MKLSNNESSGGTEQCATSEDYEKDQDSDISEKAHADAETAGDIDTGLVRTTVIGSTGQTRSGSLSTEINDTVPKDPVGHSPCFDLSFSPLSNVSLTDDEDPTKVTQSQSITQSLISKSENTNINNDPGVDNVQSHETDSQCTTAQNSETLEKLGTLSPSPFQMTSQKSVSHMEPIHSRCHGRGSGDWSPKDTHVTSSQEVTLSEENLNNPETEGDSQVANENDSKNFNCPEVIEGEDDCTRNLTGNDIEVSSQLTEGSERISDSQLLNCLAMAESSENVTSGKCEDDVNSVDKGGNVGFEIQENTSLNDLAFSPDDHHIHLTSSNSSSR